MCHVLSRCVCSLICVVFVDCNQPNFWQVTKNRTKFPHITDQELISRRKFLTDTQNLVDGKLFCIVMLDIKLRITRFQI